MFTNAAFQISREKIIQLILVSLLIDPQISASLMQGCHLVRKGGSSGPFHVMPFLAILS